jgi:hypothetical protein
MAIADPAVNATLPTNARNVIVILLLPPKQIVSDESEYDRAA